MDWIGGQKEEGINIHSSFVPGNLETRKTVVQLREMWEQEGSAREGEGGN